MATLRISKDEAFYLYNSLQVSYNNGKAKLATLDKKDPNYKTMLNLCKQVETLLDKLRPLQ